MRSFTEITVKTMSLEAYLLVVIIALSSVVLARNYLIGSTYLLGLLEFIQPFVQSIKQIHLPFVSPCSLWNRYCLFIPFETVSEPTMGLQQDSA